jgi:hypothetical protein
MDRRKGDLALQEGGLIVERGGLSVALIEDVKAPTKVPPKINLAANHFSSPHFHEEDGRGSFMIEPLPGFAHFDQIRGLRA